MLRRPILDDCSRPGVLQRRTVDALALVLALPRMLATIRATRSSRVRSALSIDLLRSIVMVPGAPAAM